MEYGGGNRWRSPRGGGGGGWHNNSPRFRGGGHNQNFSPRFGGGGGRWRHRHSSPYDPNYRQRSPFQSPQHLPISSPRFFSTPQRFFSPRHQNPADLSIDAWVSPAMWEDPWRYLIGPDTQEPDSLLSNNEDLSTDTDNLEGENNVKSDTETASVELSDDKEKASNPEDTFESEAGLFRSSTTKPIPLEITE